MNSAEGEKCVLDLYDVTIIGGGPSGLYTAFYSGMRALKTKIIEAKSDLGGLVTHFYPKKTIYDVGGIPSIKGAQLIEHLNRQAETFHPAIITGQTIVNMERLENQTFKLVASNGAVHYSRRIILAVGSGIFEVNKLPLEEAPLYENTSLFYAAGDPQRFAGKQVVISGGGNGALDWAAELEPHCKRLTVIYRGDQFVHALEHNVERLHTYQVDVKMSSEIVALSGTKGQLSSVTVCSSASGCSETVAADAVIVNHGFQCSLGGLDDWGMTIDNSGICVDQSMQTSVNGIYAIGNAASYPQKLYLIAAGFVEGPIAVNSVKHDLEPEAPAQAMVSTHHSFFNDK
ncbi:NAD(P)/FAD-dependent oxidoreductase [Sporolactobacillus terrae]|uniref:Ferredoxin--NADP reductase n=1 Tax=Sporolactobacillus terrae TaxID=269673 RepID=A0ABX5QAJ5_9BACL|nr:NAD(P)/FAD-dependent oxidoreductase [Sporolactobacillus terrae]QAA26662.1 NAD(P)/FAD-dependent oxidoreductase [Sporolactobacillus terrae]